MSPEEIFEVAIDEVARARLEDWNENIRGLVESPIEELFLAAVYASNFDWGDNPTHIYAGAYDEKCQRFEGTHLWPQVRIGPYRVDFLLEYVAPRTRRRVIVECDGHNFHEKTKEQAASDKARDRFLVARGFHVLRFTGSEITRDPFACWSEARNVLWGVADAA